MQNDNSSNKLSLSKELGKHLPVSLDAEKAVLGAILLNDKQLHTIVDFLMPDDFYSHSNKIIYSTILSIYKKINRVDLITLQDELEKQEKLESIGGLNYLLSLQEEIPALGMLEQHARLIKEKAILRELIDSATNIIQSCYKQDSEEITQVLDEAEQSIFNISKKRTDQSFVQLDIWLKKTFRHLSDIKGNIKGLTGIASGYSKLDQMTSGFQNGDLIVLAARPSMGKTALALSLAIAAAKENKPTGFFSLEMSAEQLVLRLLSVESAVPHQNIRNAMVTQAEWAEVTRSAGALSEMKFFIDDSPMLNILELRAKARKLKTEHNLQLLLVDYLQLIHSTRRYENRHQEVSEISRSLKALAKELDIPVIALSQLSRAVDSRMDKRPMLSDLRESGAIEQDADLIMFLYRDIVYNPDAENPALSELIIGKQRNGPTGTVYLNFLKELTKFEEVENNF